MPVVQRSVPGRYVPRTTIWDSKPSVNSSKVRMLVGSSPSLGLPPPPPVPNSNPSASGWQGSTDEPLMGVQGGISSDRYWESEGGETVGVATEVGEGLAIGVAVGVDMILGVGSAMGGVVAAGVGVPSSPQALMLARARRVSRMMVERSVTGSFGVVEGVDGWGG